MAPKAVDPIAETIRQAEADMERNLAASVDPDAWLLQLEQLRVGNTVEYQPCALRE